MEKNNTGDRNTGHWNTGHWNTGHCNTGDRNTGYCNTGYRNTGDRNTGDHNTGDWNTGDRNTGDRNTGDRNTGHWNTGDCNTGNCNTGNCNTGDCNTGNCNTGNCNTGHWNTGNCNTGDHNTGNWNTGRWNTGHWNTGYCNTITPDECLIFNKKASRKIFEQLVIPSWMNVCMTIWVYESDMSGKEKEAYPSYITTGGYLKCYSTLKSAYIEAWENTSEKDRLLIREFPNFDEDIFEELFGFNPWKKKDVVTIELTAEQLKHINNTCNYNLKTNGEK